MSDLATVVALALELAFTLLGAVGSLVAVFAAAAAHSFELSTGVHRKGRFLRSIIGSARELAFKVAAKADLDSLRRDRRRGTLQFRLDRRDQLRVLIREVGEDVGHHVFTLHFASGILNAALQVKQLLDPLVWVLLDPFEAAAVELLLQGHQRHAGGRLVLLLEVLPRQVGVTVGVILGCRRLDDAHSGTVARHHQLGVGSLIITTGLQLLLVGRVVRVQGLRVLRGRDRSKEDLAEAEHCGLRHKLGLPVTPLVGLPVERDQVLDLLFGHRFVSLSLLVLATCVRSPHSGFLFTLSL